MPGAIKNRRRRSTGRFRDPTTGRFVTSFAIKAVQRVCSTIHINAQSELVHGLPGAVGGDAPEEIPLHTVKFWQDEYSKCQKSYTNLNERTTELSQKYKELREITASLREERKDLKTRCETLQQRLAENTIPEGSRLPLPCGFLDTIAAKWPQRHKSRYQNVRVLLVCWMSDDLGVSSEMERLEEVFTESYNFEVDRFFIPDDTPASSLTSRVIEFIGNGSPETLLIFYYAGHGFINTARHDLYWAPVRGESGNEIIPNMSSSGIQGLLEETKSDALLLYDACFSSDSAITNPSSQRSVTDLIASSGFCSLAPGVGLHSFTTALIEELETAAKNGSALSVPQLHSHIHSRLRNSQTRDERRAPIHCELTSDNKDPRKIMLEPMEGETRFLPRSPGGSPVTHVFPSFPPISKGENYRVAVSLPIADRLMDSKGHDDEAWIEWLLKAPETHAGPPHYEIVRNALCNTVCSESPSPRVQTRHRSPPISRSRGKVDIVLKGKQNLLASPRVTRTVTRQCRQILDSLEDNCKHASCGILANG